MNFKLIGPKCSLCCSIISIWGIIQLGLMGLFFYVKSPAFIEDLYIPDHAHDSAHDYLVAMNESFHQIAVNCGIATVLYCGTLVFCLWQVWVNKKLEA